MAVTHLWITTKAQVVAGVCESHIERFIHREMQVLAGLFTSFFHFEDSLFHLEKLFILLLEQRRKISFFSLAQGGEITVYGLTETAWQVSSVGLHVEKYRHDYQLYTPKEDKTKNNTSKSIEPISLKGPRCYLRSREKERWKRNSWRKGRNSGQSTL